MIKNEKRKICVSEWPYSSFPNRCSRAFTKQPLKNCTKISSSICVSPFRFLLPFLVNPSLIPSSLKQPGFDWLVSGSPFPPPPPPTFPLRPPSIKTCHPFSLTYYPFFTSPLTLSFHFLANMATSVKGLLKGLRYISQIFGMLFFCFFFRFPLIFHLGLWLDWWTGLRNCCRWEGTRNADWSSHWC